MTPQTQVIEGLNGLLADAAVFHYKLHNFHWNVRGPNFFTLHDRFEALYNEWSSAMDELAERVLALGGAPIHTLASALDLAVIREEPKTIDAEAMVAATVRDLRASADRMRSVSEAAQQSGDKTTENLLDEFIDSTAKHIWMLQAYLGKSATDD